MQLGRAIVTGLAAASLSACGAEPTATSKRERTVAVAGPRDDVERFLRLQHTLRPPLETSPIRDLADGRVSAVVTLPADGTGEDLVHTTREALAAGLTYEFHDVSSTAGGTE